MKRIPYHAAGLALLLTTQSLAAADAAFDNASIYVPADATPALQQAAADLREYVGKMTGVELTVQPVADAARIPTDRRAFVLGKLAVALGLSVPATASGASGLAYDVSGNLVRLAGESDVATHYAVADFLEQQGVRWFMPGPLGEVVPRRDTLWLPDAPVRQTPSFAARWHGDPENVWQQRVRMGGPYFPSSHGIPLGGATFQTHPEWFALIKGQRVADQQLCVSNPALIQRVVAEVKAYFHQHPDVPWFGMGPNDGSGFCECANCRALDGGDWDPFSNEPSVTDRYVWFFNQVLDGIAAEFPDKKISFYIYHTYMRPPVKVKPNPRIVPAFAPIGLCRVHGPSNPVCPEKSYYRQLARDWKKLLPEIYERGYWFNLADPGFPFSLTHRLRDEIPLFHQLGITGWRVETARHWGSMTPSLYLAAKLLWNSEADVDALLRDFHEKFFGPAGKPMAEYGRLMDEALRDSDHHTGCSFDMPHFYPKPLRDRARKHLAAAARRAGRKGVYAERVTIFRATFDYLEAFLAMLEHRNAFEFAAAQADLKRLDALREHLLAYDPPMLDKRIAAGYLQRFFRPAIEQGYQRSSAPNQVAAPLDDQWEFLLDPLKVGQDCGWWRPETSGGNWQTIKTATASWSNQGLRYYKGLAWYRQRVAIPAAFAGRRLFLWFGGVDEKASVWLNGQHLGISHDSTFIPFEVDATAAVLPGALNTVVVCVNNERVDELGTGGIVAPVLFYAPAAGAAATVENLAPPGRTFP
jgi:hypothetical protein